MYTKTLKFLGTANQRCCQKCTQEDSISKVQQAKGRQSRDTGMLSKICSRRMVTKREEQPGTSCLESWPHAVYQNSLQRMGLTGSRFPVLETRLLC